MKCTDFEDRLNDLLDDRLPVQDDPSLAAHADECADCREVLAAQDNLFRGLRVLQRQTNVPELGLPVMAEFSAPAIPTIPPPRFQRPWAALLTSAAALIVAVSVGVWIASRSQPKDTIAQPNKSGGGQVHPDGLAIIVKPGPRQATKGPTPSQAPITQLPEFFPNPYQQRESYWQAMESLASQLPPVENLDVEHYAPSFRPIRESFEVAIDVLMRTLPGHRAPRPTPPQAVQPYGHSLDLA
ncbi:anti-sigma factor [Anatilimnocola sp. NA78]|uniref:anti-sigma factor family protein n=1 Tax=Anatilimnocola sp. NA78 TaxID=3415683 RepID=UPI003CE525C6